MKILQLCHKLPYPLRDGGSYSLYHSALGLTSCGATLKVFAMQSQKDLNVSGIPEEFRRRTHFESSAIDTRVTVVGALNNLFGDQSYFVERFWSPVFDHRLKCLLVQEDFDIIQLEHVYLCLYLETLRKYSDARVILRPQNVEFKVWEQCLEHHVNHFTRLFLKTATHRLREFEYRVAREVDGIIAISPDDAGFFSACAPGTPVAQIPIGFDFSTLESYNGRRLQSGIPVFYHLGSMDWVPNRQGIKWFIEKVIPFILSEYPGFVFRIAGKNMPAWFYRQQGPHLVVDGEVQQSVHYHEDKSVMIVPLLSGGGLRAKIIEGMALGKTIISTTIGARGIPSENGKSILIADTREEFSAQVRKCVSSTETCLEIGRNAQLMAREHFDCGQNGCRMIEFYSSVIRARRF